MPRLLWLVLAADLALAPLPALAGDAPLGRDAKAILQKYCAVCHGKDGKGNGPAAEALKSAPTDLTKLASNNGGKYPSDKVSSAIRGDQNIAAHGTKDMPIWGNLFLHMSQGHQSEVQLRIANLNKHIESLQAK